MENINIENLKKSIENLETQNSKVYFFVQDTKGNPKASVRYIYQLAMALKNNGFNSIILTETKDYIGVGGWLGVEYMELPHVAVDGQNLIISPDDFIVIPEIFGFVMEQIKDLPCGKIVLCQAYDHMLETLNPGFSWLNYGFYKCITTSEFQKEYISSVMRNVSIDILTPYISECFVKTNLTQKPIIAVHSREQRKALNFIKNFYLKFPQYRWITFRDMRGLYETEFASQLKECMLSVWIDETSGFGTFPLESMACGVPCIGKVPNLFPHWINESNGLWIGEENKIVDYTADFISNWIEDNIIPELYESMDETISKHLSTKEAFEDNASKLFQNYFSVRYEAFEDQLKKLNNEE